MGLRRMIDRALEAVAKGIESTVDGLVGEDLSPVEEEYRLLFGEEEPRPVLESLGEMAAESWHRGMEESLKEEDEDLNTDPTYSFLATNISMTILMINSISQGSRCAFRNACLASSENLTWALWRMRFFPIRGCGSQYEGQI